MTKLRELVARASLGGALFLGVLSLPNTARAEEKISDQAKLYFKNGVELLEANPPNYQDAYYQFKLAWDNSHSWKVLGNLGLCAFKLERDGEALQDYTDYLKSGGKQIDPAERKAMERDSLLISGNTAVVHVASDTNDATVLDTRAGSSVPPQSYKFEGGSLDLRLRAGTHTLTATAPDGKQQRWEVTVTPGQTLDHRFDFSAPAPAPAVVPVAPPPVITAPAAPPVAPAPPVDQATPKSGGSPLRTVGFVTAGVGGAALIGGVITGLTAKSRSSKATDQCENKVCPTAAEKDFDSASSLATVTDVLFIGGGVLAAAGVTLVIVGGHGSSASGGRASLPRLELTPAVASNGAGLFARGSF